MKEYERGSWSVKMDHIWVWIAVGVAITAGMWLGNKKSSQTEGRCEGNCDGDSRCGGKGREDHCGCGGGGECGRSRNCADKENEESGEICDLDDGLDDGENGEDGEAGRESRSGVARAISAMETGDVMGKFYCTGSHCHSPSKLADIRWNPMAERRTARLETDTVSELTLAIEEGRMSEAVRLIRDGADVHETAADGWAPVHLAAAAGAARVLEELVASGADPSVRTESGLTTLHLAVLTGDNELVRYVCDLRPEMVNWTEKDRLMTALHFAVENRHRGVMESLITNGADGELRNADGLTPLEIAKNKGYTELVAMLREYC